MENHIFFVPVRSESLHHYFARGIILPSRFYTNRPGDVQDQFKNTILLTRKKWIEGMDCAVEICLSEAESSSVLGNAPNADVMLYSGALPISRVVKVHFRNKRQSETTQWNINNGTAYLPSRLLAVEEMAQMEHLPEGITEPASLKENFTDCIRKFDMLLGSISFLNVAKPANMPVARDYFAVVGYFNTFIKAEFQARVKAGVATFDDRLTELYRKENGWSNIMRLVTDDVDIETVRQAAEKAGIALTTKFGIIDIETLSKNAHVYILALLATYGLNKQKGIDELVGKVIAGERDEQKAEEIAAIFGLHLRYSRLRNSYKAKSPVKTKFSLETRLDYYVIESVFQFVFNGKVSNRFAYIDKFVPEQPTRRDATLQNYRILDVSVPIVRVKLPTGSTVEQASADLLGDDRLVEEALKAAFPRIQEALSNMLAGMLKPMVNNIRLSYEKKLKEDARIISELKAKLSATGDVSTSINKPDEESTETARIRKTEELEIMEFSELKRTAKKLKISKELIEACKPSKQGIQQLIGLIKSNDLFYSR
jgi:hypothetical protein